MAMGAKINMTAEEHDRVSAAVRQAESGTVGEIVTIVAEQSHDYADVPLWWASGAAFLKLAGMALLPWWPERVINVLSGGWVTAMSPREWLMLATFAAMAAFIIVWLLLLYRPFRMALALPQVKRARVRNRAIDLFKVGAEERTVGRTGILIYLSLAEHRAEIVADEAIHRQIAPEAWGDAMAHMIAHVRNGHIADGMIAAVDEVGAILTQYFPRSPADLNEIPDKLIEL